MRLANPQRRRLRPPVVPWKSYNFQRKINLKKQLLNLNCDFEKQNSELKNEKIY